MTVYSAVMASWAKPEAGSSPHRTAIALVPPPEFEIQTIGRSLARVETPEGWIKKVDRAREGKVWVGYFHVWEATPAGQSVRRKKEGLAAGARRCGLVSAMGANAKSSVFYNRVKGELEEALAQLPFRGLVIARPSLLVGNRASLGQPERPLEKVSAVFMKIFGPLIPANYRAIDAAKVARTLLARTPSTEGRVVVLSGEIHRS
jgi:hypothetical protein